MRPLVRLLSGLSAAALLASAALPALAEVDVTQAAVSAPQTAAQPFAYQEMIGLNRLSDPQVSPDGTNVVYAVRVTDMEANRGVGSLWLKDLATDAEPRRLAVSDQGANTARWGSDGRLYFLSSRSGSNQVWRTDAKGRTATQVTSLPTDVQAYRLAPTADRIAVSLSVFPDCAGPGLFDRADQGQCG